MVIVTPTASGKTLCYNLPVLQQLLEQPTSRALYLFPTKALAQDQLEELGLLTGASRSNSRSTSTTETPRRAAAPLIRDGGHIVLTNPDMLHTGVLPHHTRWRRLFSSLQYVVIDELHTYRGLFGSQVANVVRRLRRICAFYGSTPPSSARRPPSPTRLSSPSASWSETTSTLVDRTGAPRASAGWSSTTRR